MVQSNSAAGKASDAAKVRGYRQYQAKNFEAEQLDVDAGQSVAASQRVAYDERRQGKLIASRALALSAAGGGNAQDPTVMTLMAGYGMEAEYRASVALYEGEAQARKLRMGAEAARFEGLTALETGEQVASGYRAQGNANLIKGAATLFSNYALPGYNTTSRYGSGTGSGGFTGGGGLTSGASAGGGALIGTYAAGHT